MSNDKKEGKIKHVGISNFTLLENEADKINVKILGSDMFRFAVKKNR